MSTGRDPPPISFSEHVFQSWQTLSDPLVPPAERLARATAMEPHVGDTDGYIRMHGSCQGHLPAFDWNKSFRKAYTILLWIRPGVANGTAGTSPDDRGEEATPSASQIMYRLSTHSDDNKAIGVCVTCSSWKIPSDDPTTVQTMLTAFTLPHVKPSAVSFSSPATYSSFVQTPLTLPLNEWSLVGFVHTFPYLKRPKWSVVVNGALLDEGELGYPVTDQVMEYNLLLQNVVAQRLQKPVTIAHPAEGSYSEAKTDDQKTASELQEAPAAEMIPWTLDMAAIALYPEAVSPLLQAIAAEAGPNLSLQKGGHILSTLPPVANWCKGSALEGPKVGIPLTVHSAALELQQLSGKIVFCASALVTRVLGAMPESQRIVCAYSIIPGGTEGTPRVGLVYPTPPIRIPDEDLPVLYMIGKASVYQAVSNYLLHHAPENLDTMENTTTNMSVALQEQQVLHFTIMPFFLALCPPGKVFDKQLELYDQSIRQLFALFTEDGALAARLIRLLAALIKNGGGRVHEEILQNGTLHVLATCLRLALLRASRAKLFREPPTTVNSLMKRFGKISEDNSQDGRSPVEIPTAIVEASQELVAACCGPMTERIDLLAPAIQIRRMSDLALTAIFGFALDLDLWGGDAKAASSIFCSLADRYGGVCLTSGYLLRSQMSVQFFLDTVRVRFDPMIQSSALEDAAHNLSLLLQSMLLSSLSNRRSISQGEHDIAACIGALSDSPLGSVGAHVVLNAIVGVLVWGEILPMEASVSVVGPSHDEEKKSQVASRLGRNLLMANFHDVVSPVILTRTVFSGEQTKVQHKMAAENEYEGNLSWKAHWRLALLLFSWAASIAGPEGVLTAQSTGSLLLASGLAGSLQGTLDGASKDIVSALFLPPPAIALMIGSKLRDEWSYTDLLSERLQVMMPLLPGMVISFLPNPSDATVARPLAFGSLTTMCDLLTSVAGTFHRVFGGALHSKADTKRHAKNRLDGSAERIKAAKVYVPQLLSVAVLLEFQISIRSEPKPPKEVEILLPQTSKNGKRKSDLDSWVDVSSEPAISEAAVVLANDGSGVDTESTTLTLKSCQQCVVQTSAELISHAMNLGGAEISLSIWRSILMTFEQSLTFYPRDSVDVGGTDEMQKHVDGDKLFGDQFSIARNVLCRVIAEVLCKALKRDYQWDIWSYELTSGVSRMCCLIEEKNLLRPHHDPRSGLSLNVDQLLLLNVIVDTLEYGRDVMGWCQLVLPAMSVADDYRAGGTIRDLSSASKLLLPVLQPCLRLVNDCLPTIDSSLRVRAPVERTASFSPTQRALPTQGTILGRILTELDLSLTAAIVGLSFSSARDTALGSMAILRRTVHHHEITGDETAVHLCGALLCKIADELKERYNSEKRLRETALFDAYNDDASMRASEKRRIAEESQAVERLILGGDILGQASSHMKRNSEDHAEEIIFESEFTESRGRISDDFVVFDEPRNKPTSAKLGYAQYDGLGDALGRLEKIQLSKEGDAASAGRGNTVLETMKPFLNAWDEAVARDEVDSELVGLFDANLRRIETKKGSGDNESRDVVLSLLGSGGSKAAADAMSTFFEFAAVEKTRRKDVTSHFLPVNRNSRVSYAERFCWARHFEIDAFLCNSVWERGVPDGNRDVRTRLPTVPCCPQFRRYIPRYLDHGADLDMESNSSALTPDVDGDEVHHRRKSTAPEIDAFTRTLLEAGNLEIVDITKKEIVDDDEDTNNGVRRSDTLDDADDDDLFETVLEPSETDSRPSQEASDIDETSDMERNSTQDIREFEDSESFGYSTAALGPERASHLTHHTISSSAFSTPPDNASSSLSIMHSAAARMIEMHLDQCLHVRAEGSRQCSLLLTSTHLILEYDGDPEGFYEGELMAAKEEAERQRMIEEVGGRNSEHPNMFQQCAERRQREIAVLRPKSIRWNLSEVSHIYLRRYRLRDSSIEMFFIPSGGTSFGGYGLFSPASSLFLDFGPGYEGNERRDDAAGAIMKRCPPQAIKEWPDRSDQFLHDQMSRLTMGWAEGRISNFDYLLHLNMLSGRSYNDICQYPVMPWVLSNYTSNEVPDLRDPRNFRDLSKPVGALNPERLADFIERFSTFADPSIPPFMYGSHYSTSAGVVLHFLVRLHPFAGLHRQLQSGYFDVADRLFSSVARTWSMCTGSSAAEVKELTPEWYCNPGFLKNKNDFKLGTAQDGDVLGDVILPPWADESPEKFIEVMRAALESEICSAMLPDWIDLIFGRKQQGPEAIKANNVFFYLTYYGSVDVASIEDEGLRQATELQIAHFGQCPRQLLNRPHVRRIPYAFQKLSFYQYLSSYTQKDRLEIDSNVTGESLLTEIAPHVEVGSVAAESSFLPFGSAPISHWVHLDAPPPGPHRELVAVRLAGMDRCLAIDSKGIFHTFRWAWRAEGFSLENGVAPPFDSGCFIAQRELPRFRTVPRLIHTPKANEIPAVAISKTLFAGRSVLLVLSAADSRGSLGMQLVDPAKGNIRGEALVPSVHSAQITCIHTDPIGTAAGHGGVGGELAIVGCADGNASIWRFMSSHYLPLRPRVRLSGHHGSKINAVSLCSALHLAATISANRCCLHAIGNGTLIRSFGPPSDALTFPECDEVQTRFASPSLAVSVQGFIVTVCETLLMYNSGSERTVRSVHLFDLEGEHLGFKPLESWRGAPNKILCTPDGTAALLCCGRGVTIHRLSASQPLDFLDEWQITESDDLTSSESLATSYDLDLGPSLNRPVVAAAACSDGVLRLHALPGISAWSERHKKGGLTQSVGTALAKPAKRFNRVVRDGLGMGRHLAGMGRDISREVSSDVKDRGVGGFLGNVMFRKNSSSTK
jgi:hypothetical protein